MEIFSAVLLLLHYDFCYMNREYLFLVALNWLVSEELSLSCCWRAQTGVLPGLISSDDESDEMSEYFLCTLSLVDGWKGEERFWTIGMKVFAILGASTLCFSNTDTHVGKLPPKNESCCCFFDIVLD